MTAKLCFTLYFMILHFLTLHAQEKPVSVGVIGLTHTHVHWIFNSEKRGEIEIVGIVEADKNLAKQYADQYHFSMNKVYATMQDLIKAKKFEAVTAFGSIYEHLEVVETFAPLGIHVMVEKPLAVSYDHAKKMESLALKYKIHLLTNYETTWYPSVHKAYEMLKKDSIGVLTQLVIRDGHRGPKNIGVNKEFLEWLIDPVKNGGGALMDFGCYGVNIATWMHNGKKPISVTAITQQLQPENNPKVDDEATIVLRYDSSKATIQASWNWPIGRKDMEVYGTTGVLYADNKNNLRVRMAEGYDGFNESTHTLNDRLAPYDDPFALFAAVIKNKISLQPYDLSSLENNMIVMEILEAAKLSAKEKRTIELGQ
ncbi:MAG: Gfo/Idh/MocA family oxidoreductase [Chitinophagaceae bacterium]|jgi:predicted dehydrogenase|nr:Gfo/Idh/MocA family oxidoreductase [Chitinophagaceae bacterium]